jgi:TetR/AcrR family transcriptional regulator
MEVADSMASSTENNQTHRDMILQAALETIAENKISGTSMRDIAKRAGISHGTLHYHFSSKTILLHAVLDELDFIFNDRRTHELAEQNLDPAARLQWFLRQEKQLLNNRRMLAEVFIDFWGQGLRDPEIRPKIQAMYNRWRLDLEEAIKEGIDDAEFDARIADLAPKLLVSIMEGAALQYLIDEEAFDLEAYFSVSYEIVLQALKGGTATREPYPTDLTDQEWELIAPLLPQAKTVGRPRSVELREVANAIAYIAQVGCPWRMLPHDFPHWKSVYRYYSQWSSDGTLAQISSRLGIDLLLGNERERA